MPAQEEHIVELFCGPEKPFSSIAAFLGYRTTTFDPDPRSQADIVAAASSADPQLFPSAPAMVWMAPPSEGFEDKTGWENFSPVTAIATHAEEGIRHSLSLARQMRPKWWFMEAPKSYLRKLPLMAGFNRGDPSRIRYTINPKDFGGKGTKEIDVWTNAFWWVPILRSEGRTGDPDLHPGDADRVPPFVYLDMFNQYDTYLRNKGER